MKSRPHYNLEHDRRTLEQKVEDLVWSLLLTNREGDFTQGIVPDPDDAVEVDGIYAVVEAEYGAVDRQQICYSMYSFGQEMLAQRQQATT